MRATQRVPFSIATTPRYRKGGYFFSYIAPLYPWSVPECKEKGKSSPIFWVLIWLDLVLNTGFPGHWRTLYSLVDVLKESEKRDEYLDLVRQLKKLWNMKTTVISIVIGAKGLKQGQEDLEIRGRVDSIQTSALLRSTTLLRRVLDTRGDLLLLRLQRKTISQF